MPSDSAPNSVSNQRVYQKSVVIKKENKSLVNYGKKNEYTMQNSNNFTCIDIKINIPEYEKLNWYSKN